MQKLLYILLFSSMPLFAQKVIINEHSATAWSRDEVISGTVENFPAKSLSLTFNGKVIPLNVIQGTTFSKAVKLGEGLNTIFVKASDGKDRNIISDTIRLTLGYKLRPEVYAYAEVSGKRVTLKSELLNNPDSAKLSYFWGEDTTNPLRGTLSFSSGESAGLSIPEDAPRGEYYYNFTVVSSDGDTVHARTYVTADSLGITPFNIKTGHASWIDKAVIYEITPYLFVPDGKFKDITEKIPELADFGITAIWLQPINATHNGGQGYDVMDYFALRNDLGTEADFRDLVRTAHSHGIKVLMDFMANHASIFHPYAEDSKKYREKSHYWNFFQRQRSPEGTPFREKENTDDGIFWYYFWDQLPNLNYNDPEVQTWMLEAMKYWIEKFDIDGYRFDAVWGVNARCPGFARKMRLALKSIKPEILLLAEDRAVWGSVFDCRFDLAFDWAEPVEWLSRWVWQTSFPDGGSETIFNSSSSDKSLMLRQSLTNYGKGYSPKAKILRFLENNDTYHFINDHTLSQTKMAAALEFSLNGVPLIYTGQETGMKGHAYDGENFFLRSRPISAKDEAGLYSFYKKLISIRKSLPALYSDNYEEVKVSPEGENIFAFRRWNGHQNVFTVLNMDDSPASADLSVPVDKLQLDPAKTYYLTDMLSGRKFQAGMEELKNLRIPMDPQSARILLLSDTLLTLRNNYGRNFSSGN
ncbi:MAG TPA: alpha-amylase family glycosyl hydrolase [Ignavibacteriales bacterium]|nr:alpha-amylase family glycosyl hydrolase [Ignavibacteriales bacterium]